jgi:FkbM family methyltransferase
MMHCSDIDANSHTENAQSFCKAFFSAPVKSRFVFGTNSYAQSIASQIEVAGFINDITDATSFLDKPIIKVSELPAGALVVSAVALGRPLTALQKLQDATVTHLDYFSFYEVSGLDIKPVTFWGAFKDEYKKNADKFLRIESLLSDDESLKTFRNIMDFRCTANIQHMHGYIDRQKQQYWEDFLCLQEDGEVFVDVGSFDGFTTEEFIKRCPNYRDVYVFEPEKKNLEVTRERLFKYNNIHFFEKGLSNEKGTVSFSTGGSGSVISEQGTEEIEIDALDNCVDDAVTYIKMDIEGAEGMAIDGARKTIQKNHPRLAICVYHKADCLWKIPEQIFSIRDDYDIYLRHYTEGVDETVMFFMPKK